MGRKRHLENHCQLGSDDMNIEIGIGIGKGSLSSLSSSDRLIAYAWASALKPIVSTSSVVHASINVVPTNSGSSALSPSVSNAGNVAVLSVIANAINTTVIPTVSGIRNASINSVIANMIANVIVPTLSFDGNPTVNAVIASSTALANIPTVSTGGASTYYLQMDGVDDYAVVSHHDTINLSNNFKISITFSPKDLNATQKYLISKDNNYALLWEYANNAVEFYAYAYTGTSPRTGSVITLPDNGKHTVIYEYNGTTFSGYLDGTQMFSNAVTFALNSTNTVPLYISGASATLNLFTGNFYDLEIYKNSVLSAHYNMTLGNVQDQSGNGNHATLSGGTWVTV
jgi:hypothetical protein